jgi:hypothetical protein
MPATTSGYLLIADITGYTAYLSQSELEHAQGVLTSLLEVLLGETKPPLVLSRLAGDAVISYALGDAFASGQAFVELVDNTYVAFRRAVDRMVMNTTCTCTACANVGTLDLKFFVHHGTFARQQLSAHEELVGNDVNLLHRLLKNHVTEATGVRAYALYTDAAIQKLGLQGLTDAMIAHTESYEHVGEVKVWIQDMTPVWTRRKETERLDIGPASVEAAVDLAMDAATAWGFLTDARYLQTLFGATQYNITARRAGRVEVGSVLECYHGDERIQQTVLEWRPFERIVLDSLLQVGGMNARVRSENVLTPLAGGVRLTQRLGPPRGKWLVRQLVSKVLPGKREGMERDLAAFKATIEAELATRPERAHAARPPTPQELAGAVRESLAAP